MNAIELEVFRHQFSSIAEEMGVALMRSAFSPNIKERRDYSCALFDASGEMIAQAAHIPVHLGSTPMSVRAAIDAFGALSPQAHVLLNDPFCGGTHLPDLTLVSPVHDDDGVLRFFVANRAHHADVGGISPGSLPLSRTIEDEGLCLSPTLWSEALVERVANASRTPQERRGDLKAQRSANHRGVQRLQQLLRTHGATVLRAAGALQDSSERIAREVIDRIPDGAWSFEDVLDDTGHGVRDVLIRCTLSVQGQEMTLDFEGSSAQVIGPINVPRAVTCSAALYVLRCLTPSHAPSNQGLMRPLTIRTVPGTIVDAQSPAAVAAGNVETSQRITDVILGALAQALPDVVPAASCGSMNNMLVGGVDQRTQEPFAYYETIAGGAGAWRAGAGAHAIQTHMTNTLNTPVEALEHAYPFRIDRYSVRAGSGGEGLHRGGDGVVRAYAFTQACTVTLMTERRRRGAYGLRGGRDGSPGENILVRDGQRHVLAGKCTFEVGAGDIVEVHTPGGGGWGSPSGGDAD